MNRLLVAILFLFAVSPAYADHGWHGGGGHWGGGWHGGWGWHGGAGNGFLGGIVGGVIGNALGNALAPPPVVVEPPVVVAPGVPEVAPWTPGWYSYCAQRYRSFNAQTGYYVGFDGKPYFCQ